MEFTASNLITIGAYLLSFGVVFGMFKNEIKNIGKQIDRLEKKQDKHNGLIERMVVVEQSTKSAHHRIDEECEKLDELEKEARK